MVVLVVCFIGKMMGLKAGAYSLWLGDLSMIVQHWKKALPNCSIGVRSTLFSFLASRTYDLYKLFSFRKWAKTYIKTSIKRHMVGCNRLYYTSSMGGATETH